MFNQYCLLYSCIYGSNYIILTITDTHGTDTDIGNIITNILILVQIISKPIKLSNALLLSCVIVVRISCCIFSIERLNWSRRMMWPGTYIKREMLAGGPVGLRNR